MRSIKTFLSTFILSILLFASSSFSASALQVPKAIPQGVSIGGGSEIISASVVTSAALLKNATPDRWAIELSGTIFAPSGPVTIPTAVVKILDTTIINLSKTEALLDVPWDGPPVEIGSVIEVCAQIIHLTPAGEKKLGEPTCTVN